MATGRSRRKVPGSSGPARPSTGRSPKVQAPFDRRLGLLLLPVFLLKLAVMLQLSGHVLTQPDAGLDTTVYASLAQRAIGGDLLLGPGLYFVSPLYIYFLAAVFSISHSFGAVSLGPVPSCTAGVGFVYLATREWFGTRAGLFAGALSALTGVVAFYESLLLQTSLDPVLTSAALASLALSLRRGDRRWYVVAGVVFGIQSLNRPNVAIP